MAGDYCSGVLSRHISLMEMLKENVGVCFRPETPATISGPSVAPTCRLAS